MYEIIPGILENEWNKIERKIEIVKPFAKSIHIDIIDGKFVPDTTFLDPVPFVRYSQKLFLELHMMVENPIQYLELYAKAGFRRFIGHIEKMPDQEEFVAQGQLLGEVGLAIDGPTQINQIQVPLDDLDNILIMTIKAGFSGQAFNVEYAKKIQQLRNEILPLRQAQGQNDKLVFEVDGGINDQTIIQAKNAGATRFAATSAIYKSPNPPLVQYQTLNNLVK